MTMSGYRTGGRRAGLAVIALVALLTAGLPGPAAAQEGAVPPATSGAVPPLPPGEAAGEPHAATGGAQTLEDILARQRGEPVDDAFRRTQTGDAEAAADAIRAQLGTLGTASDADVFRQIRFGTGDVSVSTGRPVDAVMIQNGGMQWLEWREGPVAHYGLYAIGGMVALLALFLLLRGRIRIESGRSGVLIERFGAIERFAHWLLAGSFIILAVTGVIQLIGRLYLIPLIGRERFAGIAAAGKWLHNNVAWAFMVGLVLVLVLWIGHNLPRLADLKWILRGGGMFTKHSHPPAYKFNAGQKVLFWLVILLGASVSLSGLSLLFPFELPMFAKTFGWINQAGALVGIDAGLPTELQPHQEMQYAQIWHAIVAFAMIVMIIAHIYIGTIGMEGAFDAMGTGQVDLNWAREHHNLWAAEVEARGIETRGAAQAPAE